MRSGFARNPDYDTAEAKAWISAAARAGQAGILHDAAAQRLQDLALAFGLHALGHHRQVHGLAQAEQRRHDLPAAGVGLQREMKHGRS